MNVKRVYKPFFNVNYASSLGLRFLEPSKKTEINKVNVPVAQIPPTEIPPTEEPRTPPPINFRSGLFQPNSTQLTPGSNQIITGIVNQLNSDPCLNLFILVDTSLPWIVPNGQVVFTNVGTFRIGDAFNLDQEMGITQIK